VARSVYTKLLARSAPGSGGEQLFGPPLPTVRWDVRSIDAVNVLTGFAWLEGFTVGDSTGSIWYQVGRGMAMRPFTYHWDGRQVVDNPEYLRIFLGELGWDVRITGYELTLP